MKSINPGTFEVHIWSIYVSQSRQSISNLQSILTPIEQNRANGYQLPKPRDTFITSRGYLRIILSKYLQIEPAKIEFAYTAKGKPYIVSNSNLEFNLSHSADLVVYAITKNRPIGIDLEYLRNFPDGVKIATRFFAPEEAEFIRNCPETLQSLAFFQGWTSKEAMLKATGEGIADGLAKLIVELNPFLPPRLLNSSAPWFLTKIIPASGYLAIVATNAKIDCRMFNIFDLEDKYHEIS